MDRRSVLKSMAASAMLVGLRAHAAQDAGATIIRINIPGPNMLPFLPIELIPRLGIDQALGAQLAIRYMPSGVLALDDVLAGNGDFAGIGFSVLPNFVAKGKSVAAIATLSSGVPPYSILIKPELAKTVRDVRASMSRSPTLNQPPSSSPRRSCGHVYPQGRSTYHWESNSRAFAMPLTASSPPSATEHASTELVYTGTVGKIPCPTT